MPGLSVRIELDGHVKIRHRFLDSPGDKVIASPSVKGRCGAQGELLGLPPGFSRFEKKGLRGFLGGEFEPGQDDQK